MAEYVGKHHLMAEKILKVSLSLTIILTSSRYQLFITHLDACWKALVSQKKRKNHFYDYLNKY